MLGRVEDLTGGTYSTEWGGTFHSIGARVLRRYGESVGLTPGFTIMDEGDAEGLFAETVREIDRSFLKDKENPTAKVMHNLISYARNTRQSVQSVARERFHWLPRIAEPMARFADAYQKRKLERQVTDYDDLLELWLLLLKTDDRVREKLQTQFEHVLVDEYQDTNLLQSEIIDLIASRSQIMAVGDDAQCIYTWRGANFENIASFPKRHPGAKIYKIQVNYRSTPPILNFANQVLQAQSGSVYEKELHAVRKGNLKPYIVPCVDTVAQARFIIDRMRGLYDEGWALGDICVLYRSHFHAMDLQMELSKERIPFTITSGVRFFEQAHIRDFSAQLRFLCNPMDTPAFERFMGLLPKVGSRTAQKIHAAIISLSEKRRKENEKRRAATKPAAQELSLFDLPVDRTDEHVQELEISPAAIIVSDEIAAKVPADARPHWVQLAATLREAWDAMSGETAASPDEVVRILLDGWYGDYVKIAYERAESRREDLDAMINFASQFESLPEMLAQLVLLSSETTEKGMEAPGDSLRLSTIHQAKGLEFPVVFVIGLSDGSFPLQRAIEEGDIEEERRLFYVAATRAEDELYLTYPQLQRAKGTLLRTDPSRFLQEIPGDYYEILRQRRSWT